MNVNSIHSPFPLADHLVSKLPSAAFGASFPKSSEEATTDIGVILLDDGGGGGDGGGSDGVVDEPSNELLYTNPFVENTTPLFIKLVISLFGNVLFQIPTSSILPVKRLLTVREFAPIFRG